MGTLVLVRHGQASFMAAEYDRLSTTGEAQSRKLGEDWVRRGVSFDAAYIGPRERQRRTAEIVADVYRGAGVPFPELLRLDALDEMQAQLLMQRSVPDLISSHPEVRSLVEKFNSAASAGDDPRKQFQKLFEAVMEMWVSGHLRSPEVESWADFCARVRGAIVTMTAGESSSGAAKKGRRAVAFTSGGPVAAAMQHALSIPDSSTIRVAFNVRNASVSEFLSSGSRFSVSVFNQVSHLEEDSLLTYR